MPFVYQPYENRYAGTIADLLQAPAAAQARGLQQAAQAQATAAIQSGNAWGGAINTIGQAIGGLPREIQQAQQQAQQQQLTALKLGEAQREVAGRRAVANLMQGDTRPAGDVGPREPSLLDANGLYDVPKLTAALSQRGFGDQAADLVKGAESINDSILKTQDLRQKQATQHAILFGDVAHGVQTLTQRGVPIDQAMDTVAQPLVASGILDPPQYAQIKQRMLSLPPDQQDAALTALKDQAAKFAPTKTLGEGVNEVDRYGRVIAKGGEKPKPDYTIGNQRFSGETGQALGPPVVAPASAAEQETARHNRAMEGIQTQGAGRAEAAQQETARHNRAMEGIDQQKAAQAAADVTKLTPAGVDIAAQNFVKTGTLPALGMGDKTTRQQIINRAAELSPGLDLASAKADYAANTDSLKGLQKQRDAIGAFEQTASKNIDVFLDTAGKVVDTGSPFINRLAREASGQLLGSENQAAYDAARQVAVNEVAKITSNPTLAGTLSDAARKEVEGFNPASATLGQTVRVMRILKQDMQNRTGALDDQIAGIKARIAKGTPTAPSATPTGGGPVTAVTVTAPNGQTYRFATQGEADAFKQRAGIP
jgi:hypothetical protein